MRCRVVSALKWLRVVTVLAVVVVPPLGCASSASGPGKLNDLDCYLVQMHIHGHSNHNGNDLPASMESHCSEAMRHGFDVIWWTDHARLFNTYEDIRVNLGYARVNLDVTEAVIAEDRARGLTKMFIDKPEKGWDVGVRGRRLGAKVTSTSGSRDYSALRLTLGSERGKVHTVEYCRPVTSGLVFDLWGRVDGLGSDTRLRVGFDLSLHPKGQHHVRFDATPGRGGLGAVSGDTAVTWQLEITEPEFAMSLDLGEALAALPGGDDNTLSSCYIEIGARNGQTISVALDSLAIRSTKPEGTNQYKTAERMLERYAGQYGITQYIGVEIGLFHTSWLPHMNAYFPDSTEGFGSVGLNEGMNRQEWVDEVHRRGGLVSLNHPFGASLTPRQETSESVPAGLSVRDLFRRGSTVADEEFWDIAKPIVEADGLGTDILEVGYLFRGIGALQDHLRLWDLALANGIRLVGDGASDSHGGYWGVDMVPNPFASWIWAKGKGQNELLDALRAGHVAFGDPFLWKSRFAFGVGDALMGDTLFVEGGGPLMGWVYMEPRPDDIDIRLVQVAIKKGTKVTYQRNESVEYHRDGIPIEVDGPCFVRVEVYRDDGVPLVFSNPVFIMTE